MNDLVAQYLRQAEEYSKAALSPKTLRQYDSARTCFRTWCHQHELDPGQVDEQVVCAYLAALASTSTTTTVRVHRSALQHFHPELKASQRISTLMRGIGRAHGTRTMQVKGLNRKDWERIRALDTPEPKSTLSILWRDIAIVGVMRDLLLRRSEAAELRWEDVEWQRDGGALVTIRRSKTDQEGYGEVRYLGRQAASDLKRWRDAQPALPDRWKRSMDMRRVFGIRRGLTFCEIIAKLARRAGLEGHYAGHSPRVGMAEDLAACADISSTSIQYAGRWKSPTMPAYYARGMAARTGPIAKLYGELP